MATTPCTSGPIAALTTIFTTPTDCPSIASTITGSASCFPPNYSYNWYSDNCYLSHGFFSPAICPSNYYVAASRWDEAQGPPLAVGETARICCPTGYTTTAVSLAWCVSGGGTARGIAYEIRWQSSDLEILETLPLSPGVVFAGTTTALSSTTVSSAFTKSTLSSRTVSGVQPTKTSTSSPKQSIEPAANGGLGTGAKAGMGIGAALGALLLSALIFLLWRRKQQQNSFMEPVADVSKHNAPEMTTQGIQAPYRVDLPELVERTVSTGPLQDLTSAELRDNRRGM